MQTAQSTRRYERVNFLCKLEVTSIPGGKPQPARSLDLGLGGVGLVTPASFERGQLVDVCFFLKDRTQSESVDKVAGRVVYTAADTDANRLGIEFIEPLSEQNHPKLLDKLMSI